MSSNHTWESTQTTYKSIIREPVRVEKRPWRADGRGKLLECLRADSKQFYSVDSHEFGQAYVTTIMPGVVKAWHLHEEQADRMVLLRGTVRFGVVGPTVDAPYTVVLDLVVNDYDPQLIFIPEGFHHGFKNIGKCEAFVLNIPNKMYDYENPDEVRLGPREIPLFDWDAVLDG